MTGGLSKMNRYLLAGAGVIGLLAIGLPEAQAQDLKEIQSQIDSLQATVKALQKQVQDAKAQAAEAQTTAANAKGSDLDLKVKWKGAPELSSSDGKFKFKVRGRVHDRLQQHRPGFDDHRQARRQRRRAPPRASRRRRCRVVRREVQVRGRLRQQTRWPLKDAYVAYAGLKPKDWGIGEVRFGNQYVYNSLEQITSSRYITFMERAGLPEAFFLDRQIGAAILAGSEHWSFQTGIYGAPPAEVTDLPAGSDRLFGPPDRSRRSTARSTASTR